MRVFKNSYDKVRAILKLKDIDKNSLYFYIYMNTATYIYRNYKYYTWHDSEEKEKARECKKMEETRKEFIREFRKLREENMSA